MQKKNKNPISVTLQNKEQRTNENFRSTFTQETGRVGK